MPISRSAAVRRGFAAKARCSACASEIDRGALSAASTGIVTTSTAHVRRKAAPSKFIGSTGKAEKTATRLGRSQLSFSGQGFRGGRIKPGIIFQEERRGLEG